MTRGAGTSVAVVAMSLLGLGGCAVRVEGRPVAAPGAATARVTSAAPAPVPGPPDVAGLVRCLTDAAPTVTVRRLPTEPPGGIAAIEVKVRRPDLPERADFVTVVTFPDVATAATNVSAAREYAAGTGGSEELVGTTLIVSLRAGDDEGLAAARSCVRAGS